MSSFFVVQVQTGFEIETKEFIQVTLDRLKNNSVKTIYAMETFTQISDDALDFSELNPEKISEHLYAKKIQASLTSLRNSYDDLKESNTEGTHDLLESYRESIRELTKQLREIRLNTKKVSSLLKGYILIELKDDVFTIPAELWHIIKSVPKVIGFPSKNNVPQEEIDFFFENIDLTPRVEVELDEILTFEEKIEAEAELIQKANKEEVTGTSIEKEILNELDKLQVIDTEEIVEENIEHLSADEKKLFRNFKVEKTKNKEKVSMSAKLFTTLFPKWKSRNESRYRFKQRDFLMRLKEFIQELTSQQVVIGT